MREIAFDTETTGLDEKQGHKIVEIGCVEIIDKVVTGKNFHKYINPLRDIPKASENIHGLSFEFLSDKPIFKDIAQEFLDFIGSDKLVIHNARFDMKFINFELKNVGLKEISFSRAIDTLVIARNKFPGAKATLDALCNRFGISLEKREKHGALLDSELLADVYLELLGGRQSAMFLDKDDNNKKSKSKKRKKFYEPRVYQPNAQEIKAHDEFIKKIRGY